MGNDCQWIVFLRGTEEGDKIDCGEGCTILNTLKTIYLMIYIK